MKIYLDECKRGGEKIMVKPRIRTVICVLILIILIICAIYLSGEVMKRLMRPYKLIPPERTEWAYELTEVTKLNEEGFTGKSVKVGILDTGIELTHPALKNIVLIAWKDFVNGKAEPYDDNGHGTAMAGLIASTSYGVAPDVELIVVKVIPSGGGGTGSEIVDYIIRGIEFCVNHGADVISMSLGGKYTRLESILDEFPFLESDLKHACESAINKGVFLVAGAGNDGENDDGNVDTPAVYEHVIAVGAINKNKIIASFSSMGDNDGKIPYFPDRWDTEDPNKKPELVAPGVDITAPTLNGKYAVSSGTSNAVPFVSGIIALLLEAYPAYQQEQNDGLATVLKFKSAFMDSAEKCPGQQVPHDDRYGYGVIKAYNAYLKL
jgi:serine protease AprX